MPTPTSTDPSKSARMIQLALMGLAGGLGPGAGTGILQGLSGATQQRQQQAREQDRYNQQQYQAQRQDYELQARQFAAEQQRREQILQQNLTNLRTIAPKLQDKAEYDRYIDAYTSGLQGLGFRMNPNFLRSAVPYVAPTAKDTAAKALEAFWKNPQNEGLKKNPEQLANVHIRFDRDGDGVPELVSFGDISQIAEMPVGMDEQGRALVLPKGTTEDQKANADGILASLLEQDRAEGKAATPQRRLELQKQAIRQAKEAGDLGPDPTLQAIRDLTLEQKRNAPKPDMPPAQQRRIDAKAKAFDALPVVKRTQTMAEAVSFADSLDPNTNNPADDQALIYAFAKAMDPESVVREGEYATVQKYAQSWAQTFGFNAQRVFSNTAFLTPQARANMKSTIRTRYGAAKSQYDNVRRSYASQIDRIIGGPGGDDYLIDYGAAFPGADAEGGAPTTAGAPTYQDYLKRRQR